MFQCSVVLLYIERESLDTCLQAPLQFGSLRAVKEICLKRSYESSSLLNRLMESITSNFFVSRVVRSPWLR